MQMKIPRDNTGWVFPGIPAGHVTARCCREEPTSTGPGCVRLVKANDYSPLRGWYAGLQGVRSSPAAGGSEAVNSRRVPAGSGLVRPFLKNGRV